MFWIGIDVGGTFTDAVVYDDAKNSFTYAKAPSTPADPTNGVFDVLGLLKLDLGKIERFVHGVTIGTNAVLEGKGAECWMLVTGGFKDVLEIGRTNRPVLYNIRSQKQPPLIPRTRTIEIGERLMYDGTVLSPIDVKEVKSALAGIPRHENVAIAICFLHSYINPSHEQTAKAAVAKALPETFVCTSSDVLPQFREYERFNTTALNAYIGPLMGHYLSRLRNGLKSKGFKRDLYIMTSNGGVSTAERARQVPITTVLSGPAGGVAAAVHFGRILDVPNIITCDMGGTSTDVCLIEDLKIPVTNEQKISNYANRTPQIEINAVGAGGGSIGWIDSGDILMVGPQSAGASPGPACYGRGGTEPTVTDANLVLEPVVWKLAACRRADPPRSRAGPRRHRKARRKAWPGRGEARRWHRQDRRCPHGLGDQADLDRQWLRSARLHASAIRRRRSHACGRDRGGIRDPAHPGATRSGQFRGLRLADLRHPSRLRKDEDDAAPARLMAGDRRRLQGDGAAGL